MGPKHSYYLTLVRLYAIISVDVATFFFILVKSENFTIRTVPINRIAKNNYGFQKLLFDIGQTYEMSLLLLMLKC